MVAMFVAGPVSMNTSAAPGEMPANRNPAATGVEAVAQMYMGRPTTTITIIASSPSPQRRKNDCGTSTEISAAATRPITSHLAVSAIMRP